MHNKHIAMLALILRYSDTGIHRKTLQESLELYSKPFQLTLHKLQVRGLIHMNDELYFPDQMIVGLSAEDAWRFGCGPYSSNRGFFFYRREWKDRGIYT